VQRFFRKDCSETKTYREKISAEVEDFVKMKGRFANAGMFSESELYRSPSDWWDFMAPSGSVLRSAAIKLTSLSPNTTPVERVHKVHKTQRTKPRNRLGYSRALGLNFISCEEALDHSGSTEIDWKHLLNYKILDLSEEDRDFLGNLKKMQLKLKTPWHKLNLRSKWPRWKLQLRQPQQPVPN